MRRGSSRPAAAAAVAESIVRVIRGYEGNRFDAVVWMSRCAVGA